MFLTVSPHAYTCHCVNTICKTGVGFVEGVSVFRWVSQRFCPFCCAWRFCLLETLIGKKKWRANERPRISHKNENTVFPSVNQNVKWGFENEKHCRYPFFLNSSFANSDPPLHIKFSTLNPRLLTPSKQNVIPNLSLTNGSWTLHPKPLTSNSTP
jgi:hypothetical protein